MAKIRFVEKLECWGQFKGRKHFERLAPAAPLSPENNSDTELKWGETDYEKIMTALTKRLDSKLLDELFNDPKRCAKEVSPEFFASLLGKALLSSRIDLAKSIVRFCKKQPRYQHVRVSNEFFDAQARKQGQTFPFSNLLFLSLVRKGNVDIVRFALENSPVGFSIDGVCIKDGDMKTMKWLDKELDEMSAEEKFMDAVYTSAKISQADYEVETMLTAALKSGSEAMYKHILDNGADPFAYNFQAFKVAARLGMTKAIQCMLSSKQQRDKEKPRKAEVLKLFSICFAHAAMEDEKETMTWLAKKVRDNPSVTPVKVYQKSVNLLVTDGSVQYCCYRFRISNGINELLRIKELMISNGGKNKTMYSSRDSLRSVNSFESNNSYEPADFVKLHLLYEWFKYVTKGHEFMAPQIVDNLFFLGLETFLNPNKGKKDKSKNQQGDDSTEGGSNGSPDNFSVSDTSSLNDSWEDNMSDSGKSHLSRASRQVTATMTTLKRGSISLANTLKAKTGVGQSKYASRNQKIEALGLAVVFGNERVLNKMISLVVPKDDKMLTYLKAATKRNKSATCKILLERLSLRIDELASQRNDKKKAKSSRRKTMKEMDMSSLSTSSASNYNFLLRDPKEAIREAIINEIENKANKSDSSTAKKSKAKTKTIRRMSKPKTNGRRKSTMKHRLKSVRSSIAIQKKHSIFDAYPKEIDVLFSQFLTYLLKVAIEREYKALEVAELLVANKYCNREAAEKMIMEILQRAAARGRYALGGLHLVTFVKLLVENCKRSIASGLEKSDLNTYLAEFGRGLCKDVINSPVDSLDQLMKILKAITKYTGSKILRVNDLKLFFEIANNSEKAWSVKQQKLWGEYVYLLFENMDPQEQAKVNTVSYASVADIDGHAKKAWDTVLDAAEKGVTTSVVL